MQVELGATPGHTPSRAMAPGDVLEIPGEVLSATGLASVRQASGADGSMAWVKIRVETDSLTTGGTPRR